MEKSGKQTILALLLGSGIGFSFVFAPGTFGMIGAGVGIFALLGVMLALFAVLLVAIVANLPRELKWTDLAVEDLHPSHRSVTERVAALGFMPIRDPMRVHLLPPATLVPLFLPNEDISAATYRTQSSPPQLVTEFFTNLHDKRGYLSTVSAAAGDALPRGPGDFRQAFPRADVAELLQRHRDALAWLREQGVQVDPVEPSQAKFEENLREGMRRQRGIFMRAFVRNTIRTVYRATTKRVPGRGPIQSQRDTPRRIAFLLGAPEQEQETIKVSQRDLFRAEGQLDQLSAVGSKSPLAEAEKVHKLD